MALEAVVFPQDLFGCTMDSFGLHEYFGAPEAERDATLLSSSSTVARTEDAAAAMEEGRRKKRRRRPRRCRSKEEVETQRMTHIAVERNRRKLMNHHLNVLRAIMPPSYIQRVDQASTVGAAINFVKELEQLLQSLEAQRRLAPTPRPPEYDSSPFSGFFSFPQYSSAASSQCEAAAIANVANEAVAKNNSAVAEIEVTMVERFANVKVLSMHRPRQLVRMLAGLQELRLSTLHLNVTTVDQMVLHSFSLKVEDDCLLKSVNGIATAVHGMVGKIQEEANVI